MTTQYVGSTLYAAVTQWAALTAYSVGDLRRQLAAPTTANERVFRCTTAGTSGAAEPSWTLTVGATTNDATAVWTEVTGNATYSWNAPHARLQAAVASGWGSTPGDTIYISDAHAETQSTSLSLVLGGNAANPMRILCVDDSASPPTALATSASISTTGTSPMTLDGFSYIYGLTFNSGSGVVNSSLNLGSTNPLALMFDACSLVLRGTGGSSFMVFGASSTSIDDGIFILNNTTLSFGHVSNTIQTRQPFFWENTPAALVGATIPTSLFTAGIISGLATIRGVDLSAATSGKSLVLLGVGFQRYLFENCRLGSSVSITTGTHPGQGGPEVDVINCDSADTNYRYVRVRYQGTITQETTIVRTGGASDGTTPISRRMVSTANSKFFSPLVLGPISVWNDTTGSALTATIQVITDNVTLTDAECWLEVEYLGTSGFPLSLCASDRSANILATPANQATSSETWTTTGLTTPVTQALAVTFTPQEKGPIQLRVMLARASTTVYVCPKVDIAGVVTSPQYQVGNVYINELEPSVGGGVRLHPGMSGGING